jgi:hypothetical protein
MPCPAAVTTAVFPVSLPLIFSSFFSFFLSGAHPATEKGNEFAKQYAFPGHLRITVLLFSSTKYFINIEDCVGVMLERALDLATVDREG